MAAQRRGARRVGRPGLPAAEKHEAAVSVRFTQAEAEALRQAAGREPLAKFVRRVLLAHLARARRR